MELWKSPVEGGVRQRGERVARLETFADAAFALGIVMPVLGIRYAGRVEALAAQREGR